MRGLLILLTLWIGKTGLLAAQEIHVGKERILSLGLEHMVLVENHLASNPRNDDHLLLSGMYVDSKDFNQYGNYAATSFDKGKTWQNVIKFDVPEGADPWGILTKDGVALSTVLGLENLFIFRSADGGENWNPLPVNLGKGYDHQTLVQDTLRNLVYLVSIQGNDIYVNSSRDEGKTFNRPERFTFSNLGTNTMTPVLLYDGTLLISFTTFNRPAINGSRNGGKSERLRKTLSWTISYTISEGFGTPLFLCETCETGFPVLANNIASSQHVKNLYYVCSSQTQKSIVFHYSDTEGRSWSEGELLASYAKTSPANRNPFTGMPQIAVNNDGVVGVVWQSRTEHPDGTCQYLYFTASTDGGLNFSNPVKVSSQPSCMENPMNGWAGSRYKSGGDYTGLITDKNGEFIVIWPDSRNGISQLYMNTIKVIN